MERSIVTPLSEAVIAELRAGDNVTITGTILAARDAAHKRLVELIDRGEALPIDLAGRVIYFAGPSPAKPGQPIGSVGPTTSGRMDAYSPALLDLGLKGMIGKGYRNQAVKDAMVRNRAVYFAAVGGAAALLAQRVTASRVVAYEDLGPEAIRELDVVDFPVIVINDIYGGDLYAEGRRQFERVGAGAGASGAGGHGPGGDVEAGAADAGKGGRGVTEKNRETANVGAGNWRGVGMWAWLLHRVSGLVLVAYLFAHIVVISQAQRGAESFDKLFKTLDSPLFVLLDLVLLGAVLYHMVNGIRVLLFDVGVGIRRQKTLFYAAIGIGVVVLALFAWVSFDFILS